MEDKEVYFKIINLINDEETRCRRLYHSPVSPAVKYYAAHRMGDFRELAEVFRKIWPAVYKH